MKVKSADPLGPEVSIMAVLYGPYKDGDTGPYRPLVRSVSEESDLLDLLMEAKRCGGKVEFRILSSPDVITGYFLQTGVETTAHSGND